MTQLESDQVKDEGRREKNDLDPEKAAEIERLAESAADKLADRTRRGFTITKFERHEDGYFHARVTASNGRPVYVHERFGSWLAPVTVEGRPHIAYKEVNREVVEALLDKQRKQEARERKEQEVNDGGPEDSGAGAERGQADNREVAD